MALWFELAYTENPYYIPEKYSHFMNIVVKGRSLFLNYGNVCLCQQVVEVGIDYKLAIKRCNA